MYCGLIIYRNKIYNNDTKIGGDRVMEYAVIRFLHYM